jgi:hypothetical protein
MSWKIQRINKVLEGQGKIQKPKAKRLKETSSSKVAIRFRSKKVGTFLKCCSKDGFDF